MNITELKKSLMPFIGSLTYSGLKISDIVFNAIIAERMKDRESLEKRKNEYEGLVWASQNPSFDFRTLIPDDDNYKIHFSKEEVFNLLMKLKTFYEVDKYELLIDDRKPKEGWEL